MTYNYEGKKSKLSKDWQRYYLKDMKIFLSYFICFKVKWRHGKYKLRSLSFQEQKLISEIKNTLNEVNWESNGC